MVIVPEARLAPGICIVTKSSTGPFIDTLIDFDDCPAYGRIYLGADYVRTQAGALGMVHGDHHAAVIAERDTAIAEQARLLAELDKLRGVRKILDDWQTDPEDLMSRLPTPTETARTERRTPSVQPARDANGDLIDRRLGHSPVVQAQLDAAIADQRSAEIADADVAGIPDPADVPIPLADDDSAVLIVGADRHIVQAKWGDVETLEDLLVADPPPEKVADIIEWLSEDDNPTVIGVRLEMALHVERQRENPRKTVLSLADKED